MTITSLLNCFGTATWKKNTASHSVVGTYVDWKTPASFREGFVAEVAPNGRALSRARELAALYLKAPEVTRRDTRIHFIQPLKERIVREVGYGLSLEGASSAALIKSKQAKSEPAVQKIKSA